MHLYVPFWWPPQNFFTYIFGKVVRRAFQWPIHEVILIIWIVFYEEFTISVTFFSVTFLENPITVSQKRANFLIKLSGCNGFKLWLHMRSRFWWRLRIHNRYLGLLNVRSQCWWGLRIRNGFLEWLHMRSICWWGATDAQWFSRVIIHVQ